MNKFNSFRPLMNEHEYRFIEKYLNKNDILLEYGSGNSTIYFSGIVNKVLSIEHDIDWINSLKKVINAYDINNIELIYQAAHTPDPKPCRYAQFKDYIHLPATKGLKFTKVLIDGRARKYCAKYLYDIIDENVVVFIHDFNRSDYQMAIKYYDIIEITTEGQGIVALKKKQEVVKEDFYY